MRRSIAHRSHSALFAALAVANAFTVMTARTVRGDSPANVAQAYVGIALAIGATVPFGADVYYSARDLGHSWTLGMFGTVRSMVFFHSGCTTGGCALGELPTPHTQLKPRFWREGASTISVDNGKRARWTINNQISRPASVQGGRG
ncbi:MAG TPA: hypothetical protein VIV60_11330 [Polyangiaceae bacterium]